MKAVILAAGRGTRLGDLTQDIPKPMIQIAGKPALEHIIGIIKRTGIADFVLVVKYRAEKVVDYFGDGSDFGVSIRYVEQQDNYGTGAALLSAKALVDGSPVMMTYGDVLAAADNYSDVIRLFTRQCPCNVAALNQVPEGYAGSLVTLSDDGRITQIVEKPGLGSGEPHWNCTGIFAFQPAIFEYLEGLSPSVRGEYELADAMNKMIADGHVFYPSYHQGFWRDIGTPEGIADAEEILRAQG